LEVRLVEGHVLERHHAVVADLENAVDEQERIAMGEQAEDLVGLHRGFRSHMRLVVSPARGAGPARYHFISALSFWVRSTAGSAHTVALWSRINETPSALAIAAILGSACLSRSWISLLRSWASSRSSLT